MQTSGYQSMKELIEKISGKIHQLEKGELPSSEIDTMTDECRELYERLTVLRYKAWEKGLIKEKDVPQEIKVISDEKKEVPVENAKEEKVLPAFRLNVSNATKENQQTSFLDEMGEEEKEEESHEIPVKVMKEQPKEFSVNDRQVAQKSSLAEKLQKKPISDLRTAIGLNQKFLFMNDLFEGENEAYNNAIQKLNSFSNPDDAKNYLLTLGTKYDWDPEADSVIQFTELVERRYA